jgi:diadenosine tetraphosphatase ApaH/serine/threonine PP2A family protein phosphatase
MRIAVIADMHANREAVQAVLDHAHTRGVDRYAFVGDCVGYGADPGWVVDRVREHARSGAIVVLGNHDAAVVGGAPPSMRSEARQAIDWTRTRLDPSQIAFLRGLPLVHQQGELLFVHANACRPSGWSYIEVPTDAKRSMLATRQRVTFCGHMHEPMLYQLSPTGEVDGFVPTPGLPVTLSPPRRWLAIPGAAGQPRDGDPAACYAIYDERSAELVYWRVPYDHHAAGASIRAADLPHEFASRLVGGQ